MCNRILKVKIFTVKCIHTLQCLDSVLHRQPGAFWLMLFFTSSFAIKISGITYELLIGIFYSGKSQHNFTRNNMGNFQWGLLKCLNISWNDPETRAKALFDDKKAETMGKHLKAVQNPSKYDEFLASRSGSHPKWLLTLRYQISYLITFKTAFQNILPCLNIPEFIVFLLKLNCGFPKK